MTARLTATITLAFALACATVGLASAAWAPANANHFDGRSPDTKDAATAAHAPPASVIIVGATGFDWTDAGGGAATGFGFATIAAAALALTRTRGALTTN